MSPKPLSTQPDRAASTSTASSTPGRPALPRLPRSDALDQHHVAANTLPDDSDDDGDATASDTDLSEHEGSYDAVGALQPGISPDEAEIERLRSLQLKMLQKQQRARLLDSTPGSPAARRVSPIKEEPMDLMSPTLADAFISPSPLPTAQTTSTESTESAKTIRGSMPPTPAAHQPLRTPSYPFPTVPNTPRWSNAFHQPFTSLSPTVSAIYGRDFSAPQDRIASESSTPAATATPFLPGDRHFSTAEGEDPRYPSPNLYDLVLTLGAEPGLAAWWSAVTGIMRDYYGVERATLAVPADASDIENVPWGQKTTWTLTADNGSPGATMHQAQDDAPEQFRRTRQDETADMPPIVTIPARRPKLFSHHSFAGHERQKQDTSPESPLPNLFIRPKGPLRAVSHAPQMGVRPEHPLRQVSQASFDGTSHPFFGPASVRQASFSDPEFSSIGGEPSPPTAVFNVLRALDHEPDALIDNTGITRVLERGRLVTLTRDYSTSVSTPRDGPPEKDRSDSSKSSTSQSSTAGSETLKTAAARGRTGLAPRSGTVDQSDLRLQPRYEEYEQYPSSPWAQSPAPSPAIQNDPDDNPFFATGRVDEDTFNPSRSPQDYTQYGVVEAIGVDKASTVTHIPFIHPTLSQVMQPTDAPTPSQTPSLSRGYSEHSAQTVSSNRDNFVRKAPIAILSTLSPVVPYPRNLTNSLKHLGPHLATSFSNAWQFTNAQVQITAAGRRRSLIGASGGGTSVTDQASLDDLLRLDLHNVTTSAAGSVTSPSDYSSRSRYSPGGSITGTPGWDSTSLAFASKPSIGSTPGHFPGSEAVESYFDSRKKAVRVPNQPVPVPTPQDQPVRKAERRHSKRVSVSMVAEHNEEDVITPKNEKVPQNEMSHAQTPGTQNRTHSLLHSYGADFSSSFQSLPSATTPGLRAPVSHERTRRGSITETLEMPPPSESLLRTIIDSLPVQIFTAAPGTGAITWVNSKFLIYRGQDSRQVLQDPWDSIHPEDRESYLEQWNKCLRTGQQLQKKVRLQRFDQSYRWFYIRVAPLKNKRQQIVHWIGTNMDFHEQHQAELNAARQQETAASEAKYRALANSSPQIVFVVSNRRGLTFCNSQWITFSGQAETSALGNGFLEHVHPEDVIKCKLPLMDEDGAANVPTSMPADNASQDTNASDCSSETERGVTSPGPSPDRMDLPQAKLSKLASTGILKITKDAHGRSSYSTEVRLRNKDGEYRWHLVRILLENSLAEDGDEEAWYGTATDINDHKLLEHTLKETMDAKSRFLSNMSHEIRTPLNGISGMVNFLLDSILNAEQLEHVNIIKASTDSLLNLINDILDLSKVEAGMIKLSMEWLHLPSLLEEVNDLNMGLAIQKGLELNYVVDEGVPSMVKGDKFRIRQVLLNVVGNAIKFTAKGEIFVRCRLQSSERSGSLKDNETMVRFEVIDTGRGFTENEAKYLFKRFSQIDASSTRQHGGTGLGLAISMQFVELHGGKMDARSVPNKGSTFFFTIKFGLPTAEDAPEPQVSTPGTPAVDLQTAVPPLSMQSSPLQKPFFPQIAANMLRRMSGIISDRNELVTSPALSTTASERSRDSPSLSSGSSEYSLTSAALTRKSSLRSERSSASSYIQETNMPMDPITLALPPKRGSSGSSLSHESTHTVSSPSPHPNPSLLGSSLQPPMFSILVVCPLVHSREATIRHIKNTLPEGIPHQITGQESITDAQRMIGGDNPVLFTHVVLVLHDTAEVHAIMDQIFHSVNSGNTSVVVVSDPSQKKELMKEAPAYDYEQLHTDRRLQFIYRPLKPSKFGVIFDPQKERELSTDRNQDTAQQVVVSQKLVFEELRKRIGGKGHKVLLVEDNHINQTVILKFLAKIDVEVETVMDGAQCTDIVFSKEPGYYSIILCDLHMPNKDGYQACKEIRQWEKKHNYRRHPIIALSANVLGDVYSKCAECGFNSYVTKPVAFKELSLVLFKFVDPPDPSKLPEFMKPPK
ncbi:putative histidine kinase HHK2p [Dothidotthia symphoricarpi CBS 119687]|uniref:histidine kinase n=1 Tax=Dothidotthia symphoricarpi CBS 119687 TaxID=1392245 RepID=A0A6A6AVP4_9PLEO|nr:putative histidine kinase HHK2p [Dothidotthia symphoricarpi CBS 119687]KAF2135035.1 putative histidine kinase HHK2p [Dothidotthia symphoricarpi CBS 119687]